MTDKTKKRRLAVVNADSCVACGTCFAVCPFLRQWRSIKAAMQGLSGKDV